MAGLGRKVFAAGDVLAAADVDGYLMDQTVMTFAGTAAAGSAIGTAVSEGMVRYLKATDSVDTANQIQFYNGSAWESVRDIEAGGRNKIINGGFDFWQRGISFSTPSSSYTADRWVAAAANSGDSISQQTFTPGSAPVTGYEGQYYARMTMGAVAGTRYFFERIEDVRTLAGQTATLSFWARVSSGTATLNSVIGNQNFGTGGSSFVGGTAQANTLTTTWQRFTQTANIASVAGKTIGTGSNLEGGAFYTTATSVSIDIWGVQLEAGSVATPFSRAGGTLAGELVACQRYYEKSFAIETAPANGANATQFLNNKGVTGVASINTGLMASIPFKVAKRTSPTMTLYGNSNGHWAYSTVGGTYSWSVNSMVITDSSSYNFSGAQQVVANTITNTAGHWVADAEL